VSEAHRFELAGHTLWVAPGWETLIREALSDHLRHPEQVAGAAVVKHNRVRTVARFETAQGALFCKRFRVIRAFDRALHWVKPSPARREWDALERLRAAGIDVPRAVLMAEERAAGGCLLGSVLATQEVAGAGELTRIIDRLREEGDVTRRPRLLGELARIVLAIFRTGCDHPDLHLANFLVREGDGLVALDLHSVRQRSGPLSPSRRRWHLGKLAHSLGLFDPDTAREGARELGWFADAWSALDPELGAAEPLVAHLLRHARRIEDRRLASRDRRCLVDSTSFAVERCAGARVWRRREVEAPALLAAVAAEPLDVVHSHPRGRSRIVTVRRPEGFPGEGPLLVKHYLFPSLRKRTAAVGVPLFLRAWKAARACEIRHVPSPLTYGLVRFGGLLPQRAAIVMELLADVTMIHVLLDQDPLPAPRSRRRLARDFGRLMGRFHGAGLTHRDLAVQNILVRPRADEGWDLWVIDLDEVSARPMTRKEKLRALTHMGDLPAAATRTDRLRFWRAYLEAGGQQVLAAELSEWGERGLGQRVATALEERARAKARRLAKRAHKRPPPTNLLALEGSRPAPEPTPRESP
jgi:tRNA A-37 threonylcarbamoyl transferase component Bud32